MTLDEVRKEIDKIDDELLQLLNKRMQWVQRVGEIKNKSKEIIYRPEREKQIIERLNNQSDGLL